MNIDAQTQAFAKLVIAAEIKKLALRNIIRESDQEDCASELLARLLAVWDGFDPTRGTAEAYINQVVNTQLISMLRQRFAQKRRGPSVSHCIEEQLVDPKSQSDGVQRRVDLRIDLSVVLDKMSPFQREIVDKLGRDGVAPVSREMGLPRRTLRDECERIKAIFKDAGLDAYL